jgi:3-deoxy-D-manno-octulosonic-acid transferase
MLRIYSYIIKVYFLGIKIFSRFNSKAKLFSEGRENWEQKLREKFPVNRNVIWFHCASLGEFEQGRPVMELFKKENPDYFLLLTFFSPSGFVIRKNYSTADAVFYLPADNTYNAKKFLDSVLPKIVVFVKYEFWFAFISEINKRNIPLVFISCIFRDKHFLFKWYGKWSLKYIKNCKMIFVQNENSFNNLQKLNFKNIEIAKDTRFDRVYESSQKVELPLAIIEWAKNKTVFVFGSTWHEDEKVIKILVTSLQKTYRNLGFIIVPHEVDETHISVTKKLFDNFNTKCISENEWSGAEIIIVDKIGLLSNLYSLSKIAYVGGGFGSGIHNLLEPAVFGVSVIFAKNNAKFEEAQNLKTLKAGFEIVDSTGLISIYTYLLNNSPSLIESGEKAKKYVLDNTGGSKQIVNYLNQTINKPI